MSLEVFPSLNDFVILLLWRSQDPLELPALVVCSYVLCSSALPSIKRMVRQAGWAGTLRSGRRAPLCAQETSADVVSSPPLLLLRKELAT